MITLSELPFTLNETSFREWDCLNLLQYPIDIIIRDSIELGPLYKRSNNQHEILILQNN
jgi:hypothetical protein